MRVASTDVIAGWLATVVRSLLRDMRSASICTVAGIGSLLPAGSPTAEETVAGLLDAGLIERGHQQTGRIIVGDGEYDKLNDDQLESYTTTIAGNALAIAKFNKPVTRRTAERALAALLERVDTVNGPDAPFAYRVERVVVFGSYLTDAQRLGDVDVALVLRVKFDDGGSSKSAAQQEAEAQRIEAALAAGRRFPHFVARLAWPENEVQLFLRAGSRVLSFHDRDDPILEQVETRQVFPILFSL